MANNKSAIRLHEIGPRLTIELIKIQNELFTGEVLYHNAIVKSEEEIAALKKAREEKKRQKELRKKIQNENVVKKEREKEDHKKKSVAGNVKPEPNDEDVEEADEANEDQHFDNDADYYREAVGEEPDEGIFINLNLRETVVITMRIFVSRIIPCKHVHGRSQACICTKAHETCQTE